MPQDINIYTRNILSQKLKVFLIFIYLANIIMIELKEKLFIH